MPPAAALTVGAGLLAAVVCAGALATVGPGCCAVGAAEEHAASRPLPPAKATPIDRRKKVRRPRQSVLTLCVLPYDV